MSEPSPIRLLIVDDQQGVRQLCAAVGSGMGLRCVQAESAEAALEQMQTEAAELLLAELVMDGRSGLELLAEVKRRWPLTEVALMSSCGSVESAVQAMRLGANDFVVKPFPMEELQQVLERMAEKARILRESQILRHRLPGKAKLAPTLLAPCTDLEELERLTVQRVFEQVGGDKEQARRLLGISRATLYRKIKRYGIQTPPGRRKAADRQIPEPEEQAAGVSQS